MTAATVDQRLDSSLDTLIAQSDGTSNNKRQRAGGLLCSRAAFRRKEAAEACSLSLHLHHASGPSLTDLALSWLL